MLLLFMQKVQAAVVIKDIFPPAKSFSTLGDLVTVIVKNAFVLAGVITFVLLVSAGLGVIMAGGDTKKLEKSRGALAGAITGLILVVGSFWIIQLIEKLTGLNLLNPTFR